MITLPMQLEQGPAGGRLALLDNLAPENLALDIAEVIAGIEDWLIARLGG